MFYQHFTMHCFYQFLLMSSIFTRILSLAHLFYAYFTHGPNKSASAQYDNTRGAWLTQEGCTITERKEEGRTEQLFTIVDAHRSDPPGYRLVDWHGDIFYEPELQKITVPKNKTYRVEYILHWRNKKKEALVKWFGYLESFNSWIDAKPLVTY